MNQKTNQRILVSGATGYIGGRLVPALLEANYRVRVLARDRRRLQGRPWIDRVEVVEGDVLRPETLPPAMQGVTAAYYLVHSMTASADFAQRDLQAAQNFAQAARQAAVQRIIYLGGLGDPQANLSKHLRSRQQTGEVLRQSGVPLTEFRAAIVVGSGSISFEMIRYLTERVPVMICPRWVYQRVQPIAIGDVIAYLIAALETPESAHRIIEIGGAEVLTYGEMMLGYAQARGLKRWLLPVPFLTPRLSSYWVHLVTPIPASLARPLIDGLRNEVIVRNSLARQLFPNIQPLDYRQALALALSELDASHIETSWSDALSTSQGDVVPVSLTTQEGMILERRQAVVNASPAQTFRTFARLGGETGWLYLNFLWQIRGAVDRLIGGVGLRRGRRDPQSVRVGDAIDFWRVEAVEEGRRLLLRAEMKLPGKAWLQFEALPYGEGQTRLVQTAFFAPKGLSGLAYWYLLYPIHSLIFSGLIGKLKALAMLSSELTNSPSVNSEVTS
ncbi:MAG: SDR family oxidoreductase [Anaerolineales bacterium]